MSIQITTAKQKVEFSKMVKDYKIRYYNLGPNVLYVDYIDSTGTRTEAVPAYGSFTVMSNAGNAANSYLNLYTSSGTTNIVVSKIQQDCAVDGTDLFGNVITAVDPADVASLLQKTTNMTASSGVTNFTGTVNVTDFAAISSVSIGSVELTESSLQETENDISTLQTDVTALKTKTQNQSATAGTTNFSGVTNLMNASVSGELLANGGLQVDAGTKFWIINESGLVERDGENGLIQMANGQITCDSINPKTVNAGSVSASVGLIVGGLSYLNGGFTYTKRSKTWSLSVDGLSEGSSGSDDKMFSVQNGNVKCDTLTATTQIYIPNVVSFTSDAGNNLFSRLNMSTKSDDAEVVKWYLDASDGIKFVEGQGGTGLQIGASGISMPSCFKLVLGTEASNGGVVFYGPERIRLEGGVLFGPRTGLYSIDADGNATLAGCTANTISAKGYIHGNVFKGTASGYDYFEISPGVCKLPSGNPASGTYGYNHWVGTQSDYDKIAKKDINTLYYVIQADNSVNIIKGA